MACNWYQIKHIVASRLLVLPLLTMIYCYRYLFSFLIPFGCRFEPTCSQYAIEAIKAHGIYKGVWLMCQRLLRCHPWHPGGIDPVNK